MSDPGDDPRIERLAVKLLTLNQKVDEQYSKQLDMGKRLADLEDYTRIIRETLSKTLEILGRG